MLSIYVETEYKNPLLSINRNIKKVVPYAFDQKNKSITKGPFKVALQYWIPKLIQNIESLKVNIIVEGLIFETIVREKGKNISISNVGFGISQILPLIVSVLMTPENSLCIIDEPEVHLHPALQSRLADFFIEMINLKKRIIIETHSEYIINKILYHKLLNNEYNIGMLWVAKEGMESEIHVMESDELGYIVNKPKGFLDENDDIIQRLNDERSKRL
jgi:predicted ATPase